MICFQILDFMLTFGQLSFQPVCSFNQIIVFVDPLFQLFQSKISHSGSGNNAKKGSGQSTGASEQSNDDFGFRGNHLPTG